MVFISSSRACTFLPTVSVGGGGWWGGGVNEACPTVAGPPRPSCVRVPWIYLLSSISRSKGSKTEVANGARKADRKPPLCPSPTCGCSKMRLSWQQAFVSEPTRVTSSCIYSNVASVNRSMECSFLVCCRHTRLVHIADRRRRWR